MKTVKEIAGELHVTPQAVRNEIAKQSIKTNKLTHGNGRALCVSDSDADAIKQAFSRRSDSKKQTKQSIEANKAKSKNDELALLSEAEKKALQNDMMKQQIDFLTDQIKAKDEQIRAKDEQIRALGERLEAAQEIARTAQEMAKTAQALHAGTLQKITQKDADPDQGAQKIVDPAPASALRAPAPDPERSRHWWQFWKA